MAPAGQESGQDCDGAYGQAPMRSLLNWPVGKLGHLENEVDRSLQRHCAGPISGQTRAEEARERLSQSHLIPELYLHGLAEGDFDLALRGLLGEDAPV